MKRLIAALGLISSVAFGAAKDPFKKPFTGFKLKLGMEFNKAVKNLKCDKLTENEFGYPGGFTCRYNDLRDPTPAFVLYKSYDDKITGFSIFVGRGEEAAKDAGDMMKEYFNYEAPFRNWPPLICWGTEIGKVGCLKFGNSQSVNFEFRSDGL
jgi:hypothetical protein